MKKNEMKVNIYKRGSVSVFLVIIFACLITIAAVLFAAAKSSAGRSMVDASLQLAGRSVLAEYDKRLLSDYGLLAFAGDEGRIEDSIIYYTEASLAPKDPLYLLFRGSGEKTIVQNTRLDFVDANLKEFSLYDLDIFEKQLTNAMISEGFKSLLNKDENIGGSAKDEADKDHGYGRVLRDSGVITSLPSAGYTGPTFPSFGDISDIPAPENFISSGKALITTSEYALFVFGNHVDGAKNDHFFGNEIEYLIAGKKNDSANYTNIKHRLRAMRFLLNNVALIRDKEKMAKVEAIALAAAAVSFETLYEPVKIAVMEAWVAAETGNDLMLLEKGKKVALFKTSSQWATHNIDEIWAGWTEGIESMGSEPTEATDVGGFSYKDYLRLMLYLLDRETKLLRIMDLMQINLKGTYYEDFLMREHYVGFRFSTVVDGDFYAYTETY